MKCHGVIWEQSFDFFDFMGSVYAESFFFWFVWLKYNHIMKAE